MGHKEKSNIASHAQQQPKEVKAEIQKGLDALSRGEKLDGKEVFRRLKLRMEQSKQKTK